MLLCACMSVSAYTGVQAADLSSGSSDSDVQIEMEEVDDSEDEADFTDAEDGLFSDGSDDTQTGDISAIANQIVAQAQSQAQDYQEKKQASRKVIDAREVERRAQSAGDQGRDHKDPRGSPGGSQKKSRGRSSQGRAGACGTQRKYCTVRRSVCRKSIRLRWYKSDKRC